MAAIGRSKPEYGVAPKYNRFAQWSRPGQRESDSDPRKPHRPAASPRPEYEPLCTETARNDPNNTPLFGVSRSEDFGHIDLDTMRRLADWLGARSKRLLQGSVLCQAKTIDQSLPPALRESPNTSSETSLAAVSGRCNATAGTEPTSENCRKTTIDSYEQGAK